MQHSECWQPGTVDISNTYKWNNIKYPATPISTPLSSQVEELQHIVNINARSSVADQKGNSAVYDTGATSNCGREGDDFIPTTVPSAKVFQMPTGETTPASTQSKLHHRVREPARTVDMVPALTHNSLLSGPKFADANYVTILTPTEVLIYDAKGLIISTSKDAVLKGWRDKPSGLWRVPLRPNEPSAKSEYVLLPKSSEEAINNVYELPSTKQAVRYLHACAGFPTKATWIKAIRAGNYASWPHLTLKAVQQHFPESDETQQGHMRSVKQGIRSTKEKKKNIEVETVDGETVTIPLRKHHDIYVRVEEAKETIYSDQTGAFPVRSRKGNRYIMVMCEMDSNAILSEAMRDRSSGEMIRAYRVLLGRVRRAGLKPKKHVLDNECSAELKEAISSNEMTYELVPKGQHRRNIAEKAIQTWKAHAIGVFSGMDSKCPLFLWDLMLEQIDMQVNMLRQSNAAPKISAHAHMHGQHDFNRQPLAPLGIEVHSYIPPDKRRTWSIKSKKGYYIGTSRQHYRYFHAYIPETGGIQGSETMYFKHKYITMPSLTLADAVVQAAKELVDALRGKLPPPLAQPSSAQLKTLSDIFTPALARNEEPAKQMEREATSEPDGAQRVAARSNKVQQQRVVPPSEGAHQQRVQAAVPARRIVASEIVASGATPSPGAAPMVSQEEMVPTITQDDDDEEGPAARHESQPSLPLWMQNYVARARTDTPASNTRSRRSITDEIVLASVEMSTARISPRQAARRQYPVQILNEMANAVLDETTGDLLEYRHLIRHPVYQEVWGKSMGKEIGRLAQGLDGVVEGTDTLDFITRDEIPQDRWGDVTYARIVCNYRPEKKDPNRVRITVGGNRINYPGDCGTPTADIFTFKMLLNSIISTPGARFMTMDISNFYLMTPLKRKEYLRMKLSDMPTNVINQYNLRERATADGYVFVAVKRGMYGLPQAGILAQELLEERLNAHGYHQSKITPGLWTHEWRPICFTLVVDDFGVKYVGEEHALHLLHAIKENYDVTSDWTGRRYLGLTLDWDYAQKQVHLSMPEYVPDALVRFKRERPKRVQTAPHASVPINYGAKQQFARAEVTTKKLDKEGKLFVQQVLGTFLYYARAVDCTMLVALSAIATDQACPTEETMKKVDQFLDYAACNPLAIVTYHASDMVLAVHSDASYLSESKARSRAGGHFFLSADTQFPANNGAVHTVATIIKAVMSSAAEAEIGAMFVNARAAVPARRTLEEMGHPQPKTPMQTDNAAAHMVVTNNVQPKRTNSMDMRFHWLRDRAAQKQFRYYWRPGPKNLGDYHTKHHPGSHHVNMRGEFLSPPGILEDLRRRQQLAKLAVKTAQGIVGLPTATLSKIPQRASAAAAA